MWTKGTIDKYTIVQYNIQCYTNLTFQQFEKWQQSFCATMYSKSNDSMNDTLLKPGNWSSRSETKPRNCLSLATASLFDRRLWLHPQSLTFTGGAEVIWAVWVCLLHPLGDPPAASHCRKLMWYSGKWQQKPGGPQGTCYFTLLETSWDETS